jgi:hypothetical protein
MKATHFKVIRYKGGYFWRATRSSDIVASGCGYNRKATLLKSLRAFLKSIKDGDYTIR